MVVVLLLPVVILLAACLLDLLERRVVAAPPAARVPIPRTAPSAPPHDTRATDTLLAEVVPLHPGLDGDTLRLRRAS